MTVVTKSVGNGYVSARFTSTGFLKPNNGGGLGANTSNADIVSSLNIVSVQWSVDASGATIARGANTVLKLFTSGSMDLQHNYIDALGGEPQANTVVTIPGNGSVVIKFHKKSALATGIY